jgi:hypothetical protein
MESQGRSNQPLRYRFSHLSQALFHVKSVSGRNLFFFRSASASLPPYAPVSLEWCFDSGEPSRLVHGWVLAGVPGEGMWIELLDTRPLRELGPTGHTRRFRRLGSDHLLQISLGARRQVGRMLDLSEGGARLGGLAGIQPRDRVELRLLAPDRLTFFDLGSAFVAWADLDEIGVEFDRDDRFTRRAVGRLVSETEEAWNDALEARHPVHCCALGSTIDPDPPRLVVSERPSLRIAG